MIERKGSDRAPQVRDEPCDRNDDDDSDQAQTDHRGPCLQHGLSRSWWQPWLPWPLLPALGPRGPHQEPPQPHREDRSCNPCSWCPWGDGFQASRFKKRLKDFMPSTDSAFAWRTGAPCLEKHTIPHENDIGRNDCWTTCPPFPRQVPFASWASRRRTSPRRRGGIGIGASWAWPCFRAGCRWYPCFAAGEGLAHHFMRDTDSPRPWPMKSATRWGWSIARPEAASWKTHEAQTKQRIASTTSVPDAADSCAVLGTESRRIRSCPGRNHRSTDDPPAM